MGWRDTRIGLRIVVFGSWDDRNLPTLETLVGRLQDEEYLRARLVQPLPGKPTKAQIAANCEKEAAEAEIAIFVLFREPPQGNVSAALEFAARLHDFEKYHGAPVSPDNTLVFPEDGCDIYTVLEGKLEQASIRTSETWEDTADLCALVRGTLFGLGY